MIATTGKDGATLLAQPDAWPTQAVHLAVAGEGLLPAFGRNKLYEAATWTLLRHGAGTGRHAVGGALALGIASLAAAGDPWEVRALFDTRGPCVLTLSLTSVSLR